MVLASGKHKVLVGGVDNDDDDGDDDDDDDYVGSSLGDRLNVW